MLRLDRHVRRSLWTYLAVFAGIALVGELAFAGPSIFYGTPERVTVEPAHVIPGTSARVYYSNADAEFVGRTVYVHYGVNGWNVPFNGAGAGTEIDNGNQNYFLRQAMRFDAARGRYEVDLPVPTTARAMHFAFCWNSCGVGEWDNNSELDYSWPVVFPYIGPILTWNENTQPSTSVVVSFENSWFESAWIEYSANGQRRSRKVSPAGLVHRFELTGLTPNTTYSYRVGVGSSFVSGYNRFKTAKSPVGLDRLSFVVFGDAQDNGENGRFAQLATEIATNQSDVDFIISTGDLPWNDHGGDWWSFFDKSRVMFASKVTMPSVGNHDTPSVDSNSNHRSFVRYFALPGIDLQHANYRFNFGPAEFYAMNSERQSELAAGGSQYRWISEQLDRRRQLQTQAQQSVPPKPLWSFAYWHIPPFNAGARHYQQQYGYRDIAALFDGVLDWHFGGHEHLYQRLLPLKTASGAPQIMPSYGLKDDEGVGYLIVPSSGVPGSTGFVSASSSPELRERLAFPLLSRDQNQSATQIGYTRVDIRGNAIDLKVYSLPQGSNASAVVIDRVQYQKN